MIEDSEDDATLLLHVLQAGGYDVVHTVVNTAAAMRNALERQEWDVITSDHRMPGFSAGDALALTMELRPNLPFLIVSGAIDIDLAVSLMKEGAKDYVPKQHLPRLVPAIERELREVQIRTERKHAEERLQAHDAYLTAIIENQPGLIWLKNVHGRFQAINHAFAVSCGRETRDVLGKTDLDIWPRDMAEKYVADDGKVMQAGQPIVVEEMIYDKNEPKWFETFKTPIKDAHGNIIGTTGYARDITERKLSETKLRAAEEQFRGLVEQSITGIYIIQDGKFAYVNPRFAEIRGFGSADELIGRDPAPLIAEKDRNTVSERNRRLLAGETRNMSYSFTALRKDGSIIEVGLHATGATYRGRAAIIGVMQDISEKTRAEEEIRKYIKQLKSAFMSTVEVATSLSEMRDPYTAGHERRVAQIAVGIGTELGFDENRLEGIRVAGHLHDVGKITIPAEILSKPGKLSAIEFQLIQAHAQAGYEVLKDVAFPWPAAEVARQHHERMDGSGYPLGLEGDAILLEARIMAVADVVEAMSSHRPYRPGLGIDRALAEIERGRGTAYDPVVVDACLKLFREGRFTLPN